MLRTITFSLLMLISFGAILPLDESGAYGIRQSSIVKRHHYRKHSRAWWRRYRARLRRRREAALAAMAHRRALLALRLPQPTSFSTSGSTPYGATPYGSTPASTKLPNGWNNVTTSNGAEMKFRTGMDSSGVSGQVTLAVVAQSRPMPMYLSVREQRRMLAGISVTDLRRIVIDKMIVAGGWVTNDYQRDVNGCRVFVVTAQTPSDARTPEKSWNFYFTEINGQVYSLTTNTPRELSDRVAAEAESFITSLHANSTAGSQASQR